MRSPTQPTASCGPKTGAGEPRSSMHARSLNLLAKVTVVKKELLKGFHELVRQHLLRIAPRNAVELPAVQETCSAIERKAIDLELATQSFPDDLGGLAQACGAIAGNNPRPNNILRRSLARIQALRQTGEKRFDETTSAEHTSGEGPSGPAGGTHCAPEPYSMRLRPHIPVPLASACELQKPPPPPSQEEPRKNPRRTHQNPRRTQEEPTRTHRQLSAGFPQPGALASRKWHGLYSLWTAWLALWHGLEVFTANHFGIWRSLDAGVTWSGLNDTLPNLPVRRLRALSQTLGVSITAFSASAGYDGRNRLEPRPGAGASVEAIWVDPGDPRRALAALAAPRARSTWPPIKGSSSPSRLWARRRRPRCGPL